MTADVLMLITEENLLDSVFSLLPAMIAVICMVIPRLYMRTKGTSEHETVELVEFGGGLSNSPSLKMSVLAGRPVAEE
jgi:hypothetical protein